VNVDHQDHLVSEVSQVNKDGLVQVDQEDRMDRLVGLVHKEKQVNKDQQDQLGRRVSAESKVSEDNPDLKVKLGPLDKLVQVDLLDHKETEVLKEKPELEENQDSQDPVDRMVSSCYFIYVNVIFIYMIFNPPKATVCHVC
jgi:lysyl-tRNA synthetase class I